MTGRDATVRTAVGEDGDHRLRPSATAANYIPLRLLAAQLRSRIDAACMSPPVDVIDIGCGDRPYEPLFSGRASSYVGVDYRPGPKVDVIARADQLPFEDDHFAIAISSQVLEHVPDPEALVREAWRVLRPGGVAFFTTHGVANYHPNPDDFWRWTHAGLVQLLRRSARWQAIEVVANGGTASAMAYLAAQQAEVLARRAGIAAAARPIVFTVNAVAWNIDRAYARRFRGRPPDLAPNYLATAVKAG